MGESRRDQIRKIQALIPANEPIVAWLMTPYWLDFSRNPVFTVDPYGWAMPWSRMPAARYFIWEYSGLVVRKKDRYEKMKSDAGAAERMAGVQSLAFVSDLEVRARPGQIIYNDGAVAVWRTSDAGP
ncbi:MAG: hypothetical protein ACREH8_12450 [Opitutaceae bacterium]